MACVLWLSVNNADTLQILAAIGTLAGLFLFYRGFRMLQRKRLILNTPTSKIRSASLGLVEVSGLAFGPYTMMAPITGKPCYYYRTLAWELKQSGKNKEWCKVADESLQLPFYLDDNTGRLLVNPQGAELDLHRDFHQEYSNSFFSSDDMPQNARAFLSRYGVGGDHKIRIDEYCIKPKNALFILGTLAENPGLAVTSNPVPTQTPLARTFKISLSAPVGSKLTAVLGKLPSSTTTRTVVSSSMTVVKMDRATGKIEQQVIQLSPNKQADSAAQMSQQEKIAAALTKAGISNPAAWAAAGIGTPPAALASKAVADAGPLAAIASVATAASKEQFDLNPKTVLMKGENNSAFLISWRSQREVAKSLAWKSALCIWCGPALTLLSVYVLLLQLGWL